MEFPDDFLLAELGQLQLYNDSLFHNNFSSGYNETDALLPTGVKVTIVVVYMIVCVVGLVGNFLVMYVVIRSVRPSGVQHTFTVRLHSWKRSCCHTGVVERHQCWFWRSW